jgi:hypothetical protein
MRIGGWNYCNLALLFLFYTLSRKFVGKVLWRSLYWKFFSFESFVTRYKLQKTSLKLISVSSDIDNITMKDIFWTDLLKSFFELKTKEKIPLNVDSIIWYNSSLKIEGKTLFYKELFDNNIIFIKDFFIFTKVTKVRILYPNFNQACVCR